MRFKEEIENTIWNGTMDENLSSYPFQNQQANCEVELINIPHTEIVAYLEGRLTTARHQVVEQAVKHPYYQAVIAGTKMMLADHDEFETYQDVSDYLEKARKRSWAKLKRTCR